MLALTIAGKTEHVPDEEKEAAMQRYWSARTAGDATAHLIRLVDAPPSNRPPDEDPDDDPPPAATPARAVSPLAVARIAVQEGWLAKHGFVVPPPLYAPGTRVVRLGDENFRVERQRVEGLPPFAGAASAVQAVIREEKREDIRAALGTLALTERGTLLVNGTEEVALEVGAFYQLAAHAGFGMGARYLAELTDGPLRADNVNRQLAKRPTKVVTLRVRSAREGVRHAYATVTPTYAAVDSDRVLDAVKAALDGARTELAYDGSGVRATALFMPDRVVDLAAGDIFKAGVRVEADDTGRGRVRVSAVVWRNRCLNLLILGEGTVETVSQVHRGSPERILSTIAEGVNAARAKIGDFLEAWGHARSVLVDPQALIRQWVEEKKVHVQSARDRDQVVEHLLAAWQKEPGVTLADAVNAVSRAAHETPSWGMNIREELERQAARLVLVPR